MEQQPLSGDGAAGQLLQVLEEADLLIRRGSDQHTILEKIFNHTQTRSLLNFSKGYLLAYNAKSLAFRRVFFIGDWTDEQKAAFDEYVGYERGINEGKLFKHVVARWRDQGEQSYIIPDFATDPNTNPDIAGDLGITSAIASSLVLAQELIGFVLIGYSVDSALPSDRRIEFLSGIRRLHDLLVNYTALPLYLFDRYSQVRRFAYGIIHDLGNLPILTSEAYLADCLKRSSVEMSAYEDFALSAELLKKLRDELMLIANEGIATLNFATVAVQCLVEEAVRLAIHPRDNIEVHIEVVPKGLAIEIDRLQILRTLWNLLKNARESVQAVKYRDSLIEIKVLGHDGMAELAISDNGRGIRPEDVPLVFDLFFSDKPSQKQGGYGLGLTISKMIIEEHHGSIRALNNKGGGATFAVSLPITQRRWR